MPLDKAHVLPQQQSQQKTPSEKSRSKKGKEPKPRVKKLKYHQYVPPDQKLEASEAPMDSSYARLLQQQQLFLQLQIISQQQQHYNYQTILPAPLKYVYETLKLIRENDNCRDSVYITDIIVWISVLQAFTTVVCSVFFSSKLAWLASITLYLRTPESKPNIVVFKDPEGH